MFVLIHRLRESPLSVVANRFELRCRFKQLLLLCYTICPCCRLQDTCVANLIWNPCFIVEFSEATLKRILVLANLIVQNGNVFPELNNYSLCIFLRKMNTGFVFIAMLSIFIVSIGIRMGKRENAN